jgi:hypothetical protein
MSTRREKIIKPKLVLLENAKQLGNVSQAGQIMDYGRDTFYRYKKRCENGGEAALYRISRKKPQLPNRMPEAVELAVQRFAVQHPAYPQLRAANPPQRTLESREEALTWWSG